MMTAKAVHTIRTDATDGPTRVRIEMSEDEAQLFADLLEAVLEGRSVPDFPDTYEAWFDALNQAGVPS